jgi:hypothetical protein
MFVLCLMLLDNPIRVPYLPASSLYQLIDHRLYDPNTHLIILTLVIMIDSNQIFVNNQEDFLSLKTAN